MNTKLKYGICAVVCGLAFIFNNRVFSIFSINEADHKFLQECAKIKIDKYYFPGDIHFSLTETDIIHMFGKNYSSGYFRGSKYVMYDDYSFFFNDTLIIIAIRNKTEKICNTHVGSALNKIRKKWNKEPIFDEFEGGGEDDYWVMEYSVGDYFLLYYADDRNGIVKAVEISTIR